MDTKQSNKSNKRQDVVRNNSDLNSLSSFRSNLVSSGRCSNQANLLSTKSPNENSYDHNKLNSNGLEPFMEGQNSPNVSDHPDLGERR